MSTSQLSNVHSPSGYNISNYEVDENAARVQEPRRIPVNLSGTSIDPPHSYSNFISEYNRKDRCISCKNDYYVANPRLNYGVCPMSEFGNYSSTGRTRNF